MKLAALVAALVVVAVGLALLWRDLANNDTTAAPLGAIALVASGGIAAGALARSAVGVRWAGAGAIALAALLAMYPLLRIPTLGQRGDFNAIFLAWALACLLYALAFARSLRLRWRVSRRALALLALITLLGAGLRLWDLGGIPYNFGGDEAEFARWSLSTINGRSQTRSRWAGWGTQRWGCSSRGWRCGCWGRPWRERG